LDFVKIINSQPSTINPQPPRKWPRRLLWLAGFCFLFSAFCFVFRAPLLTGLATAWVINEPLHKADAIVILGGDLDSRPFGAAVLYKQGLAPRIIHLDVKFEPENLLGLGQSEPELTRQILVKNGVPESALTLIGHRVTNTWEEAEALRNWMQTNAVRNVIVATDLFHTRRARWLFKKELAPLHAQVQMASVVNPHYAISNWWQSEIGLVSFQNEWIKLPYYWLKY
jgi:uncharacterized SAM-binding protein YcdF (DUF218 family)